MQCEGSKAYSHEIWLTILHINTDKIRVIVILLGYLQVRQAPYNVQCVCAAPVVFALLTNIRLCWQYLTYRHFDKIMLLANWAFLAFTSRVIGCVLFLPYSQILDLVNNNERPSNLSNLRTCRFMAYLIRASLCYWLSFKFNICGYLWLWTNISSFSRVSSFKESLKC